MRRQAHLLLGRKPWRRVPASLPRRRRERLARSAGDAARFGRRGFRGAHEEHPGRGGDEMTDTAAREYTTDEMMTVAAARELKDGAVCFVGIGLPSEATNLVRATHAPNCALIYES